MLQRVRLTDFKSFVDEEVTLGPLTILLGANASGKSNFLDAFRFLHQTAVDQTLADILDGPQDERLQKWTGLRGGSLEAARIGTQAFSIETSWLAASADVFGMPRHTQKTVELTHAIECQTQPQPRLNAERLSRGPQRFPGFKTGMVAQDKIEVSWLSEAPAQPSEAAATDLTGTPKTIWLPRVQVVRASVRSDVASNNLGLTPDVAMAIFELSNVFVRLQFPAPTPDRMRAYGRRRFPLRQDGRNISGVLADLCADPNEKRSLVDWLSELCAPEIADIDFIEVPERRDVMAVLIEKSGKRISAPSLSDGTLRFLGLLLWLRTAPPGSVVFLEDIESHLHPTRIKLLVEYLEAVTRTRNIQVIATTHSPVVLPWLTKEALGDAIVFGRVPEREGTVMRRLADLPHFEEVSKLKGADELFSTGWLEMAL